MSASDLTSYLYCAPVSLFESQHVPSESKTIDSDYVVYWEND